MKKDRSIQIYDTPDLVSDLRQIGAHTSFIRSVHNLFHINRIEDYIRMINFPDKGHLAPRKVTVSTFFFLAKGKSIRKKGLTVYEFEAETFFFTPAYEILTHEYISPDAEGFYAHFNIDLLTSHYHLKDLLKDFPFLKFNCHPLVEIKPESKPIIIALLKRLEQEYQLGEGCRMELLRTYLYTLFMELKQFVQTDQQVPSDAAALLTEQYKNALSGNIQQKQKVSEYAAILSVSPNHLNKCVRQTLNKTAIDLLHEMLLLEAKVLLKQTHLSISEIAYKVGRNEATDFARFFKRKTGIPPSVYRERVV